MKKHVGFTSVLDYETTELWEVIQQLRTEGEHELARVLHHVVNSGDDSIGTAWLMQGIDTLNEEV